ncbi:MAG TPA: alpha/beta hydrolase-fold protein [Cyclobacteriaceae bacterium]|nr:alpha/beta hydrolase-fold protein [Cyclobacteriaceae bacterium]HRJ83655.1 alpha/beta hydrolase-fold protein [Cyclobacteriaceae bacterium]
MEKQKAIILKLGVIAFLCQAVFYLNSCEEAKFDPALTRTFTIESPSIGASYPIQVALPDNFNSVGEKFSTIYVLDGKQDFNLVANTCKNLSERYGVPNVIVVSIGYGRDRSMDYTPTKSGSSTGGAPEFLKFIENELIPKIEQDFNADTARESRVILGHSYGGLFAAFAFAVNNNLFGNYIMLSPSLWFDNEVTLLMEKQNRNGNQEAHQLVFMGIGEAENSGRMQAPFEAYYQILRDHYSDMSLSKNREHDLSHMGSKDPNIVKGLHYYFQNR